MHYTLLYTLQLGEKSVSDDPSTSKFFGGRVFVVNLSAGGQQSLLSSNNIIHHNYPTEEPDRKYLYV
ncbi:hypothetical protein EON65_32380 [archaeon]|nr:MAG: hypothetical protein EON65_32380 [archaeon]